MKKVFNLDNNIIDFKNIILKLFFAVSIIYIIISIFYLKNFGIISNFLDKGYDYNKIYNIIKNYDNYFIGFISIYILFLGYIKDKKGVIFGIGNEENTINKSTYGQVFLMIFELLNIIILLYIYYLFKKYFIYGFFYIHIIFLLVIIFGFFLFSNSKYKINDIKIKEKVIISKISLLLIYLAFIIFSLIFCFTINGYFEIFLLIFINFLIIPLLKSLLTNYITINSSTSLLSNINGNKITKKEFEEIVKNISLGNIDNIDNIKLIIVMFNYIGYFIKLSVVLSVLVITLGIILKFNIFSIIYIHLLFIYIYIGLNIISNKFSAIVDIKFDGELREKRYF